MRRFTLILLIALFSRSSASAVIDTVKNSKGAYYEVIENKDGSHTFIYVLPSTRCKSVSVYGLKDKRVVFGVPSIQVHRDLAPKILRNALREHSDAVIETSPVIQLTVHLDAVDKLTMHFGIGAMTPSPVGTNFEVDLHWLGKKPRRTGDTGSGESNQPNKSLNPTSDPWRAE